MAILTVLHYPHPNLRKVANPVETFDAALKTLASNMLETMYQEDGIGLAATQVDVQKRLIVIDISEQRNDPLYIVNPELVTEDGRRAYQEGCLSVPGFAYDVERADAIVLNYQTLDGKQKTLSAEGLLATCIQHEIDHLNGKLFIDYLSPLKRNRVKQKLEKLAKQK